MLLRYYALTLHDFPQHTHIHVHADTGGKLPYEVQAAAAAAAEAEATAAKAAAEADALRGIPGASASWNEVAGFVHKVQADIASNNMEEWLANGMQRALLVDTLYGSWQQAATTGEQKRMLHNFIVKLRAACPFGV